MGTIQQHRLVIQVYKHYLTVQMYENLRYLSIEEWLCNTAVVDSKHYLGIKAHTNTLILNFYQLKSVVATPYLHKMLINSALYI